ncbi:MULTISPECIES: flagellar motor switch protein FliG [unclassified Escherichia]|uniref:flagellar motor switch protein FliG n=1 Tax=unclassified Escherichia TaxID=2608889 RepID=UPI00107F3B8A|nr:MULTISPECIES: flagellar motor switch protein FliG [unclassified Escherichia]TGB80913.1 flagellar motor switch protein FliG [Escherichia sp. E4694]TGC12148.1 flagellar motor switch protein FliG [Escherichia sp. E4385]TLJ03259.1 flagellar motor switch protein FliG [Escherichia sp. E4385]
MNAAMRSAIIMLTLGDDRAAEVLRHLNSHEVAQISSGIVSINNYYTHEQISQVLSEFKRDSEEFAAISINADEYLRNVLVKALGENQAEELLDTLLDARGENNGIETLGLMEPYMVYDLIREEHPQIIATILVHLKRAQAANVLAKFEERERNDIILRIATFNGVQPVALQELTDVLNGLLHGQSVKRNNMGGIRPAAEILNLMKTQQEEAALAAFHEFDPELAQKIIDEMFLFENLVDMDDRSIQRLLEDIDGESLLVALKGADQVLREKFFSNMSKRQAEIMRDDLNSRGPVRMALVEAEQKSILLVVRRLVDSGEITIGGGEDVYV